MGSFRSNTIRIFLSAGEASGDLHGSHLVRAIKARQPAAEISCLGGALLRESGAELVVDNRDLAVVGLFEVLHHASVIYRAWRRIKAHLIDKRPQVTVLIDFPDFNFLLARLARRLGSRVFYYISPQVWAWRSGRVRTLKRLVDRMAVILPFEPEFFRRCGMDVTYVGHPLLDVIGGEAAAGPDRGRCLHGDRQAVVGLLPGSRHSEVRSLLPVLLETAALMHRQRPNMAFLLPVAATLDRHEIEAHTAACRLPIKVVSGDTYRAIRACDLVLTASGTVTLEAAILGTPMIIVYRVSAPTYYAGRHLIRVQHVGLPNLIAGRRIVPELLQQDARADRIAGEALALLDHPELLARQRMELASIRGRLGTPGVADRVADLVLRSCPCAEAGARD